MVKVIRDLESRGLVNRNQSSVDRRTVELHVTEKGREHYHELSRTVPAHDQEFTRPLDDAERTTLIRLLEKLA